jgi:tetratricopeptide (TPR) repeat protein
MKRDHGVFLTAGIVVGFALGFALAWGFGHAPQPGVPAVRGTAPALDVSSEAPAGGSADMMGEVFARVEELRRRIAEDPRDSEAVLELASLQQQVGKFDQAREVLQGLLDVDPDNLHGLTHLGLVLAEQDDLDGARERFARTVELDASYWQGWFYLAVTEARREDYDAARVAADRLEALQPDLPELAELRSHLQQHSAGAQN